MYKNVIIRRYSTFIIQCYDTLPNFPRLPPPCSTNPWLLSAPNTTPPQNASLRANLKAPAHMSILPEPSTRTTSMLKRLRCRHLLSTAGPNPRGPKGSPLSPHPIPMASSRNMTPSSTLTTPMKDLSSRISYLTTSTQRPSSETKLTEAVCPQEV